MLAASRLSNGCTENCGGILLFFIVNLVAVLLAFQRGQTLSHDLEVPLIESAV